MRSLLRKPTIPYGPIAAALSIVVILLGIVLASRAHAESQMPVATGEHLITLHDNGQDRGILSNAKTLRDAFKEAGVQIDPNDKVEPGLDEVLVAAHYEVNVYRARPVTVIDGTLRTKILSPYQTPEQIVKHANITLQDEDVTVVSANTDMVSQGAGLQVAIDRATPFTFVLYGKKITAYTQSKTVGDMLDQKKVTLAKDDALSLPKATPITPGMTVELWRDGKQTVTEDQDVAFDVEKVQDADRELGYKAIKTPGVVGKRTVSYEIEMKNGKEVSRQEIQSVTTKESVKQVEIIGAKVKGAYTTPGENEIIIWNYLISQGFSREQTAGIMGNLKQEHGFNTTGDGLVQWTGARKTNLLSRPDPYNIYTQLDFLMSELNGGYSKVQVRIRASATVDDAVIVFQNGYEGCSVCVQDRRIQFAYNILASH